ncbi:hypothetical protein [Herpetosiphon giganteus]|uniref:hypothetical protein n=1 Tax=Herpetosiphon giganteus TaxID=2029754 RepID=UPI0019589058|nr:hypothetical protein [Herpetosiphon giganteus]MBM7845138.1 hypothetical protein [Herpetosiphon giganteus]
MNAVRARRATPTIKALFWSIGEQLVLAGLVAGPIYGVVMAWLYLVSLRPMPYSLVGMLIIGFVFGGFIGCLFGISNAAMVSLLLALIARLGLVDWLSARFAPNKVRWIVTIICCASWIIGCFSAFYGEYGSLQVALEGILIASIAPTGAGIFIFCPWLVLAGIVFWRLPNILNALPE